MISRFAAHKKFGHLDGFRWRGDDISRIEGLSDAVFAFAVTLLIVSLEVPKTFDDLLVNLRGFLPFAACFAQLMIVWYQQYIFFRRYNLEDFRTIVLTMVLLFVVLFYIYPLKFLWTLFLGMTEVERQHAIRSDDQIGQLMTLYGIGVIVVFVVIYSQFRHAWKVRDVLELTPLEEFDTRTSMAETYIYIGLALVSIAIVNFFPIQFAMFSGAVYMLTGPIFGIHGHFTRKKRKLLMESQ